MTWAQLLKRPEITIEPVLTAMREELSADPLLGDFAHVEEDPAMRRALLRNEARAVETEIKFAGYLEQQKKSYREAEGCRNGRDPGMDKLRCDQRPFAGDAGNAGAGEAGDHRAGKPDPGSNAGGAFPGACLHSRAGSRTAAAIGSQSRLVS